MPVLSWTLDVLLVKNHIKLNHSEFNSSTEHRHSLDFREESKRLLDLQQHFGMWGTFYEYFE